MQQSNALTPSATRLIGLTRILLGLIQGLAIYLLLDAFRTNGWPASSPLLYGALFSIAINVPLIATSSIGQARLGYAIAWVAVAMLLCGLHGLYFVIGYPLDRAENIGIGWSYGRGVIWSTQLACALFVAHCLITAAARDERLVARYRTYFDVAWQYGLQAVLAVLFTAVLWLVLWLGATLFGLIKITAFAELIAKNWFYIPATAVSVHCAFHLTDLRSGLVQGLRSISCNLLAWLLPLLTIITGAFVVALPFTGLQPLWATKYAALIVLSAAAGLIFLINAVYQDGERFARDDAAADATPRILRFAVRTASVVLAPLIAIAAYGLWLRIDQYGWTPQRVLAVACCVVATFYAIGYVIAAARQAAMARSIATTNIVSAFVIVAAFIAVLSPIADPVRISLNNQMQRLMSGAVTPEKFDYPFLRRSGSYGWEQLRKLADQKEFPFAAQRAEAFLKPGVNLPVASLVTNDQMAQNITVVSPKGAALPDGFIATVRNFPSSPYALPDCLRINAKCDAIMLDLTGTGSTEIVLFQGMGYASVFQLKDGASWTYVGGLPGSHCPGLREALRSGDISLIEPAFKDVKTAGVTLRLIPHIDCRSMNKK